MLETIASNKWFKISKYSTGLALILASIFALVAAWMSGIAPTKPDVTGFPGDYDYLVSIVSNEGLGTAGTILGFLGLIAVFFVLGSKNPKVSVIATIVGIIFVIVLFSIGTVAITDISLVTQARP